MKRQLAILSVCIALGACGTTGRTGTGASVRLPDAPPAGEPSGTTGLHEADLRAAYGQPAFVRKDGTAQIWRFDGAGCKAFFFLYARDNDVAVWHVETNPRGSSIAADENCLSGLRARAASRPTS